MDDNNNNNTNTNNNMVSAAPDLNLSAFKLQVESVLSDLVKVATVELTKVLESRYRALVLRRLGAEPQPQPPAAPAPAAAAAASSSSCSVGVQASRRYACNMCALEGKRAALVTDTAGALGRRMTEHMDQRFQAMEGKMTETLDSINRLQDEVANEKVKSKPSDSSLNSVTLVLLCLWVIVVYYSYRFSLENQALTDTVKRQQTRLHNIYSVIAAPTSGSPETCAPCSWFR
ncbi:hypothetical protein CRUP_007709, partial [Coryphaenoides rupestris]